MANVVKLLGIDPQTVNKDFLNILSFEKYLDDIARKQMYNTEIDFTLKDLLTEDQVIQRLVDTMTEKLGNTDPRIVANYVGWRVAYTTLPRLNKEARTVYNDVNHVVDFNNSVDSKNVKHFHNVKDSKNVKNFKNMTESKNMTDFKNVTGFSNSVYSKNVKGLKNIFKKAEKAEKVGNDISPQLWRTCVQEVGFSTAKNSESLSVVTGSMFLRYFHDINTNKIVVEMMKNIKKAFNEEILKKADWLDEKTRIRAQQKLNKMKTCIGNSEEYLNKTIIDRLHKNLAITPDDYFENTRNLNKFRKGLLISGDSWLNQLSVTTVNAQHSQNQIEIPAGILQFDFFNSENPNFYNYGSTGATIGHEIGHGFDNYGKGFNEKGSNHFKSILSSIRLGYASPKNGNIF
jgi:hypothetical protein